METVKVDVQKLQLLNERITQAIDALNQVRMSAHGIQHTPPWAYGAPYGVPAAQPVGVSPAFNPYAQYGSPYAATPFGAPLFGGFQHSSPYQASLLGSIQQQVFPYATPYTSSVSPLVSQLGSWSMPYFGNGISQSYLGNGISHSAAAQACAPFCVSIT